MALADRARVLVFPNSFSDLSRFVRAGGSVLVDLSVGGSVRSIVALSAKGSGSSVKCAC